MESKNYGEFGKDNYNLQQNHTDKTDNNKKTGRFSKIKQNINDKINPFAKKKMESIGEEKKIADERGAITRKERFVGKPLEVKQIEAREANTEKQPLEKKHFEEKEPEESSSSIENEAITSMEEAPIAPKTTESTAPDRPIAESSYGDLKLIPKELIINNILRGLNDKNLENFAVASRGTKNLVELTINTEKNLELHPILNFAEFALKNLDSNTHKTTIDVLQKLTQEKIPALQMQSVNNRDEMWEGVQKMFSEILSELKKLDEEKLTELQDKNPEHATNFELAKIEKKMDQRTGNTAGDAQLFVDNFIKLSDLNEHSLMLNTMVDMAERNRTISEISRGIPANRAAFLNAVVDKLLKNNEIDKVIKLIHNLNPSDGYRSICIGKIGEHYIVQNKPAEALKHYEEYKRKDPSAIRNAVEALTQKGFSNHDEIDLAVRSADTGVGMIKRISTKVLETGIEKNNLEDIKKAISVAEELEKNGNSGDCSTQLKVIYEALLKAGMHTEAREAADKIPIPERRELALRAIDEYQA